MIREIIDKHTTKWAIGWGDYIDDESFPALEADLTAYLEAEMIAFAEWLEANYWRMGKITRL